MTAVGSTGPAQRKAGELEGTEGTSLMGFTNKKNAVKPP